MPYKIHGNHANVCIALGNLKSSFIFRLIQIISTETTATFVLIFKDFKKLNKPILKIDIATIVYIKKEYFVNSPLR